jgi:UDP:flavonoid glycosyltransferase YjiC (YdhE family)
MATLLLAWELGGGLGHSVPLGQIAAPLLAQGHSVHFALRDLSTARLALGALADAPGVQLWQAPVWLPRYASAQPAASYAELLFAAGFLDGPRLLGLAQAWRSLFDALQPDLLLADHAPTALLAARAWQRRNAAAPALRLALVGNGYFMPPALQPMPPLRPWEAVPAARLAQGEALVLAACNQVLQALGAEPLPALHALLQADLLLLLTWPELDPWSPGAAGRGGSQAAYLGPLPAAAEGAPAVWPAGQGPRVLAYVKSGQPELATLLAELARAPCRTLAYVPGLSDAQRQRHANPRLCFSEGPINLRDALPLADAVVCPGGAGTVGAALRAGRPLLLLPAQGEQLGTAFRVRALGAGLALGVADVAAHFQASLQGLLARAADGGPNPCATAAAALAQRHAGLGDDPAAEAARRLLAALAQR